MSKRTVLATFAAFIAGTIFASGLVLGGMTMPKKVIGFLDFTGNWDPSLLCVMIGAIAVYSPLYHWIARRNRPLLDDSMHLPAKGKVDRALVAGAVIFGVGWGLVGLCPGPAVTALATGAPKAVVFFMAMLFGTGLVKVMSGISRNPSKAPATTLRDDA